VKHTVGDVAPRLAFLSTSLCKQSHPTVTKVRELASGMRQLAGTKTRYRRAVAAPLAGLISGRAKYKGITT